MSLVFSATASHSPLLIPEVGKENSAQFVKTKLGYEKLSAELLKKQVETLVVFSPHGLIRPQSLTINICPKFTGKFEEFGDLVDKFELDGDLELANSIKQSLEAKTGIQAISESVLDSGSAVPLFFLSKQKPDLKILPIYPSQENLSAHYELGKLLKKELFMSKKKIGVLASADLSHRLSDKSPAGRSPKAEKFDKKVLKLLQEDRVEDLLELSPDLLSEVKESALRQIALLFGVLDDIPRTPKLLSYESPFGVGCLTFLYTL